jgi:hypothetical protein
MGTGATVREDDDCGTTGMRDFVDKVELLDGNLIDFVHDVDATDVHTVS